MHIHTTHVELNQWNNNEVIKLSLFEVNLYGNRVIEGGVVHKISSSTTGFITVLHSNKLLISYNLQNRFVSHKT